MRELLTVAILFLLSSTVFGQGPVVVPQASKLTWDDPNPSGLVTEFFMYVKNAPGIVPDGNPEGRIAGNVLEWLIPNPSGEWWAVVTATAVNGTFVETGPSNEVWFAVMGAPQNLRIVSAEEYFSFQEGKAE